MRFGSLLISCWYCEREEDTHKCSFGNAILIKGQAQKKTASKPGMASTLDQLDKVDKYPTKFT